MPTNETEQSGPAISSSSAPTVSEVTQIVQEWVDLHARHRPNFVGAYLWGGITAMPPDAPFPLYRDVDVVVVVPQGAQEDTVEVFYRGLLLEVIALDLRAHQDAEAILANPSQGPNLATTQILADPTGLLTPLQATVAAGYGRRRWVAARCAAEKTATEKGLTAMH